MNSHNVVSLKIIMAADALQDLITVCRFCLRHEFSVLTSLVIKTKDHNHPINKFKNLGYDSWLLNKETRQESGFCCTLFACYSQKCVTQIYRALYGTPRLYPLEGHKHMAVVK